MFLGKFCAGTCVTPEAERLLKDDRYADDMMGSYRSLLLDKSDGRSKFLVLRDYFIRACKEYGFPIKLILSTWGTNSGLMEASQSLIFDPDGRKEMFSFCCHAARQSGLGHNGVRECWA